MSRRFPLILIVLALACAAVAETPPDAPPVPERAGGPDQRFIVIPIGQPSLKQPAVGKLTLLALPPTQMKVATIVFYIDDQEIGRAARRPYGVEWDSTSVPDGEHTAKWKALDAEGAESGSGSLILVVANSSRPSVAPPPVGETPERPVVIKPNDQPTAAPEFMRYSNAKYDIAVEHPAAWTVKDQTTGLPKGWSGGYWLVFSTDPLAKAMYVVNLRHRLLQREHTPESFTKQTPYVATWEQTVVNGRPAFVTTAGTPAAKRVVHRVMMLEGRNLWMMNCIDTSGKPADESKALFMRMVQSVSLAAAKPAHSTGDPLAPER